MFQNVVLGKSGEPYEAVIKKMKAARGYKYDSEMTGDDWEQVVGEFKTLSGNTLPTDPYEQLEAGISAVFNSWFTPRAVRYRGKCVRLCLCECFFWLISLDDSNSHINYIYTHKHTHAQSTTT